MSYEFLKYCYVIKLRGTYYIYKIFLVSKISMVQSHLVQNNILSHKLPRQQLLLKLLSVLSILGSLVTATACSNANYQSLLGSIHTYHRTMFAAPNSQNDIIVAGNYNDRAFGYETHKLFAYLFKQSDCSYVWTYQGGDDFTHYVRGVGWSHDEKKAYMLAYPTINQPLVEYLVVFDEALSSYKGGSPTIYQVDLDEYAFGVDTVLDSAQLYGLASTDGNDHVLIVHPHQVSYFTMYPSRVIATSSGITPKEQAMHSTYNSDTNALYLLQYNKQSGVGMVTKQSMVDYELNNDHQHSYQIYWHENGGMTSEPGGRVGLYYDSAVPSVETIWLALSQTIEQCQSGAPNCKQSNINASAYQAVDIVKFTFNSDYLDCSAAGNCERKKLDYWAKVIAIAPQSTVQCKFLIFFETGKGIPVVRLLDVNLSTSSTYASQSKKYTTYTFDPEIYNKLDLMSFAYYNSGVFQDFYLSTVQNLLPEASTTLMDDDGFGNLGAVLKLTSDRTEDFFGTASAVTLETLVLTPEHIDLETYEVTSMVADEVSGATLVYFNGQVKTEIAQHGQAVTGVQAERQIVMNSTPHRVLGLDVPLAYSVGQAFWTSFVTIQDYESSYPTGAAFRNYQAQVTAATAAGEDPPSLGDAKLDVVSVGYGSGEASLPDAESFFTAIASPYISPSQYEIRSGEFTIDHIGTHTLNVTVADEGGARTSFQLSFSVVAATLNDGYASKTDMTDEGYEAYLLSILGEEGLEDLKATIAEAEQELGGAADGEDIYADFDAAFSDLLDDLGGAGFPSGCDGEDEEEERPPGGEGGKNGGPEGGEAGGPGGDQDKGSSGGVAKPSGGDTGGSSGNTGGSSGAKGKGGPGRRRRRAVDCPVQVVVLAEEVEVAEIEEPEDFDFNEDDFHRDSGCKNGACEGELNLNLQYDTMKVDSNGIVTIYFKNSDLNPLRELWLQLKNESGRLLQYSSEINTLADLNNLFKAQIIRTDEDASIGSRDTEQLLNMQIVDITDNTVELQIYWENPEEVSRDGRADQLKLVFNDEMFKKLGYKPIIAPTLEVIPKQKSVSEAESLDNLTTNAAAAGAAAQAATVGITIGSKLLYGSISQLWGLINGLSLFVHLPLTGVEIPEQTLAVLGELIKVAQFDLLENEEAYGPMIPFMEEDDDLLAELENFGTTGYESSYAFINMGTNVIVLTILFFFMALLVCLHGARKSQTRCGRFHRYCSATIYWNFWLRMLIQGCLEIGIAAMMYIVHREELYALEDQPEFAFFFYVNDFLSFFFSATVFLVLPLFVLFFYCLKFDRLSEKAFNDKYGAVYDSLKTNKRSILFFPMFFLVRRFVFILMAFQLSDEPGCFIFVLLGMTMIEAAYLFICSPFETQLMQGLEVFNEMTSFILLYIALGFTQFISDDALKLDLGWVFNSIMGINICVHLYFMLRSTARDCKKKCRERKMKKQLREAETLSKKPQSQAEYIKQQEIVNRRKNTRPTMAVGLADIEEEDESVEQSQRDNVSNRQSKVPLVGNNRPSVGLVIANSNILRKNDGSSRDHLDLTKAAPNEAGKESYYVSKNVDVAGVDIFMTPRLLSEEMSPIRVINLQDHVRAVPVNLANGDIEKEISDVMGSSQVSSSRSLSAKDKVKELEAEDYILV